MNTDTVVRPKLMHYGLITGNLNEMVDWYGKVLGMTVNQRAKIPAIARWTRMGPPFSAFAFLSNDELDHRVVFFEIPKVKPDPDKGKHTGLQHVAFEYASLNDLLSTYSRLKALGIVPLWAADHGVSLAVYYQDPDRNVVELNLVNYETPQAATEYLRNARPGVPAQVDLEKLLAAHKNGASPWELHERAMKEEFVPDAPFNPGAAF